MTIISEYLQKLGFDADAIQLYTTLTQFGPLPILETSRKSGLERTKLYRLIEILTQKGLIEEIPQYKRHVLKAAGLSTLEMMVKETEVTSKFLTTSFPAFTKAVETLVQAPPTNNVVYYHGREGLRQMAWHLLRTQGLYRTCSYRFWDEILGSKFTLSLNQEMIRRRLKVHDLFSDQYFNYKKQWLKIHGSKPPGDWTWWRSRFISEKILKIDQNIDIYNDVVAYYSWQGEETFGVEIYNSRVSLFHQQMHDLVWKLAKPTPHFDWTKDWK